MRRAKIVATIGPAISSYENLSQAIRSGMNVARLNMSHGDHSVHDSSYENLRRASVAFLPSGATPRPTVPVEGLSSIKSRAGVVYT